MVRVQLMQKQENIIIWKPLEDALNYVLQRIHKIFLLPPSQYFSLPLQQQRMICTKSSGVIFFACIFISIKFPEPFRFTMTSMVGRWWNAFCCVKPTDCYLSSHPRLYRTLWDLQWWSVLLVRFRFHILLQHHRAHRDTEMITCITQLSSFQCSSTQS